MYCIPELQVLCATQNNYSSTSLRLPTNSGLLARDRYSTPTEYSFRCVAAQGASALVFLGPPRAFLPDSKSPSCLASRDPRGWKLFRSPKQGWIVLRVRFRFRVLFLYPHVVRHLLLLLVLLCGVPLLFLVVVAAVVVVVLCLFYSFSLFLFLFLCYSLKIQRILNSDTN